MLNIVIAAGYATRLSELTKNFPKPLLEIGKTTILGRMLDDIDRIPQITEHVIVTNHKFAHIFEEWAAKQTYTKPIRIIDDGTETNETRLGAVCDIILAIKSLPSLSDVNFLPQGGGQVGAFLPRGRSGGGFGRRRRQHPPLQLPGVRRLRLPEADLLHHVP